jgi:2,3-dihydroxyphenylpropionate 1,2-dioxygenase
MENGSKPITASAGIVAAAIVPHAPQLLSMPETEDLDQVARVKAKMRQIGDEMRALDPDLIVVVSNSHGEELAVDCVPALMIHCGDRANGAGKHQGRWLVDGEAGQQLTSLMMDEGFDPAFTFSNDLGTSFTIAHEFCGFSREVAFLPIFLNVYVPPQPSPQRCFAYGKALARCFERMGRRTAVIVSGGLSHYPATPMYPTPDLATDQVIFERMAEGNLLYLMSFDATALDKTGNVESRSLQLMAGCIGDRKPDHAILEPSWHHIYAVLGWTRMHEATSYAPLYPGFTARHSELARALNTLMKDNAAVTAYRQDRGVVASQFDFTPDQAAAFIKLDEDDLRVNFAVNPMLTYMVKLRVGDPLKHRSRIK